MHFNQTSGHDFSPSLWSGLIWGVAFVILVVTGVVLLSEDERNDEVERALAELWKQRGDVLFGQGNFLSSEQCYRRALSQLPLHEEDSVRAGWYFHLALSCYRSGYYPEALEAATTAIEWMPGAHLSGQADGWSLIGLLHNHLGKYRDAIRAYQRSATLYRRDERNGDSPVVLSHVYLDRASCYYQVSVEEGDRVYLDSMMNDLRHAALLVDTTDHDEFSLVLHNLGAGYLAAGERDSGLAVLARVYQLDSLRGREDGSAQYYINLAETHAEEGELHRAVEYADNAVRIAGNNPELVEMKRIALANLGTYSEALGDDARALRAIKAAKALSDSVNEAMIRSHDSVRHRDYEQAISSLHWMKDRDVLMRDMRNNRLLLVLYGVATILLFVFLVLGMKVYRSQKLASRLREVEWEHRTKSMQMEQMESRSRLARLTADISGNARILEEKERVIHELESRLTDALKSEFTSEELVSVIDSVRSSFGTDRNEERLGVLLNEESIHFFHRLKRRHPDLSRTESRLSILVYLNMDSKEIARLMNISTAGVKKGRNRLRKKLGLPLAEDISNYLQQLP